MISWRSCERSVTTTMKEEFVACLEPNLKQFGYRTLKTRIKVMDAIFGSIKIYYNNKQYNIISERTTKIFMGSSIYARGTL